MKMKKRTIIDADKPLSQSLLWQIQRTYFLQNGMKAWQDDVVPSAISSNPVMARTYSQILFGYLRDCFAAACSGDFLLDSTEPIYIVELGAGSGRLAHHFLHTFMPRYRKSPFSSQPIKYIMTDFVPEILEFWQGNGRFQPWIDAGVLDIGLFDVMDRRPLCLINNGQTLTPQAVKNPVVLIANYFFDSIPQDSFVIENGLLCQNLLTLTSSQPEPDFGDPAIWDRLRLNYEPIPLEKSFYGEPLYNQILDSYEEVLPDSSFSFPNVGLDSVNYWRGVGNGRLLLLTSDRGYTSAESLINQSNPLPNLHGSFSLMVNYHAMGEYVTRNHGLVCQVPHYQDNIQVLAYLLGQVPQRGQETQLAFVDGVGEGGPDDFQAIKGVVEKRYATMTLPELLSFLRLSGWDATIFADFFAYFRDCVHQADPVWYDDVHEAVMNVQRGYLPLSDGDELSAHIEQLLAEIGYEV